jgi:hypothetical protein
MLAKFRDHSVTAARLNPDSSEILFVRNPDPQDRQGLVSLMRVPLVGGTPHLVLSEPYITNFQCSRGLGFGHVSKAAPFNTD